MAIDETKVLLSTRFNILKIFENGSTVVNISSIVPPFDPAVDYVLKTHNLGYVPRARVWYEPVAAQIWPMSDKAYSNSDGGPGTSLTTLGSFYLTSTALYVRIRRNDTGGNKTFYWRIYLDE